MSKKKKKLQKKIAELEKQIEALKLNNQILMKLNQLASSSSGVVVTTPCDHDFGESNGTHWSVVPPSCIKCGCTSSYEITSVANAAFLGEPPFAICNSQIWSVS